MAQAMTSAQLRKFIEQRGLTQAEAARRVDVNVRQVRRWLAGDAPVPLAVDYALRYLDLQERGEA
jgi:transcriptional regulator with XRE-family HTH domain